MEPIMTEKEMVAKFKEAHPNADISRDGGERICPVCRKRAIDKHVDILTGTMYVGQSGRRLHAYYRTDEAIYGGYRGYCGNACRPGKFPSVSIRAILKAHKS